MRWEQYGGMEALAFDMGTKLDCKHLVQSRCNGGDWCETRLGVCANASLEYTVANGFISDAVAGLQREIQPGSTPTAPSCHLCATLHIIEPHSSSAMSFSVGVQYTVSNIHRSQTRLPCRRNTALECAERWSNYPHGSKCACRLSRLYR